MTTSSEEPSSPPTARKPRRSLTPYVVGVVFIAGALLNPGQNKHFEEIGKVIQQRELSMAGGDTLSTVNLMSSYHNYFLFSTVTFGDNRISGDNRILSYGFFGVVKTTDNIKGVVSDIFRAGQQPNASK